jgi:hypothetical protein
MKTTRNLRLYPPSREGTVARRGPAPLAWAVAVLALGCWPTAGRAGLSLTIEPAAVTATAGGGPGSFEVWITNNGTSPVELGGFAIQLSLEDQGATNVTFTDVTKGPFATPTEYVFADPGPPPFTFDVFQNIVFIASDAENDPLGGRILGAGATYGLALVSFDPGNTIGTAPVKFLSDATSLSDPSANPITDFTTSDGTIAVLAPVAVPEPSTLVPGVLALGVIALGCLCRRRGGGRIPRVHTTP